MTLWFEVDEQEKILIDYMPRGAAYKQARINGSNFNNLIKAIGKSFEWLAIRYNNVFRGLFITEGAFLLSRWKVDYGIPSRVFPSDKESIPATSKRHKILAVTENRLDIYALRYLMNGNAEWNFRAIANLYLVDIIIEPGDSEHPQVVGQTSNYITISYVERWGQRIPYKIPHYLTTAETIDKIKAIYQIIKPSHIKITYIILPKDTKIDTPRVLFPPSLY